MVDDHLIFLVTIPIHDGSNEGSEKDVFGSEKSSETIIKSSERSSETTAISSGTGSGTHPHKVLGQAKLQRQAWGHPYNRNQAKFFLFIHKVAKASMRFLPFLSHRTIVSVDKC